MTAIQLIFYLFAALAIGSALLVVCSNNPVRSSLCLVLTFFSSAALWMLLESEFLAITLVLVYVGAVMVLFLFVVMMIDIEQPTLQVMTTKHLPLALLVAASFIGLLYWMLSVDQFGVSAFMPTPREADYSSIAVLGEELFTNYLMAFELAGVILLVAIVSAISLTFRGKRSGNKSMNPSDQIRVRKSDRLKIISMPSESNQPNADNTQELK